MTTGLSSFSGRAFSLRCKRLPVPGGRLAVDCGKHPAHVAGIAEASLLGNGGQALAGLPQQGGSPLGLAGAQQLGEMLAGGVFDGRR